jgi:hypothetical protein
VGVKKVSLQGWFAYALTDKSREEAMTQVTLVHMTTLGNGIQHPKEIASLKANIDKPWDAATLANWIETQAGLYAQNLKTTQEFNIICKYGKNDMDAEHPYQYDPEGGGEFHGLISHAATNAGEKAQGMQLLNMICGRSFTLLEENMNFARSMMEEYRTANRENSAEIRQVRAENREMWQLVLAAAQDKVKLGHEQRMAEMKFHRDAQERMLIIRFAPTLINQFVGKEIFPQGTEDTSIIETIATSIPEDVLKMITSQMPPFMGGPILARLTRALKEEREAQEKAREATMGSGTPPLLAGEGGLH